jgi:hypothetical protein
MPRKVGGTRVGCLVHSTLGSWKEFACARPSETPGRSHGTRESGWQEDRDDFHRRASPFGSVGGGWGHGAASVGGVRYFLHTGVWGRSGGGMWMARGMASGVVGRCAPGEGLSAMRADQPDGVASGRPEPGASAGALEEPRGVAAKATPRGRNSPQGRPQREGPDPSGSGPCSWWGRPGLPFGSCSLAVSAPWRRRCLPGAPAYSRRWP